ncbi:NAD(P)-dependent oxidoreductase [Oceanibaculum pacificum]|uniref:2-hydroxy-3-oxopropionate reductase n=1 Tax=Oceanibaculum pacificum TaxID=580166 RepID=A0A154VI84_9PROT|nr:NAD(P)-dependent oxidoreductase [Oceanibaculum pacificum]KZD01052.1 2-hydroxy-3-oxopropionate reductase [Oceanibaculum pacificum]
MAEKIGFIGLGVMGNGMARNLLKAGFDLTVWTRDPAKVAAFRELGASVAETPKALAAACPLVISCVPDASAIRAVAFGADGLVAEGWPGGLLVDCSTIAPFEAQDIAAGLAEAGAAFLDAPISGGKKGADEGTLTIMIGGEAALVARARPAFEAMGKNIHHVGPSGAGQALKACNQLMVAINLMGVCEAVGVARAAGIDPKLMREVLSTGTGRSGVLEGHGLRYLEGTLQGGFRAALMKKDLGIATAVGAHYGVYQPATGLAHQLMTGLCNAGHANLDNAALGLLYDMLNGGRESAS